MGFRQAASRLRDFRRRAAASYALPTLLLVAVAALLAALLPRPGLVATKLLAAVAVVAAVAWLWRVTRRTNLALARFVATLAHGDLAQGFRTGGLGTGFDELGAALDGALSRLRAERHHAAAENRFAAALVDEVPTPLLTIGGDGVVHLANKAARRLFRESDGRGTATFARYGGTFATTLATIAPGGRQVAHVLWNGRPQRALVTAAAVDRRGRPSRIVSVSIIQGELERAEIATQADLVRVLTHEIMNSLTPVTSLAASAAAILAELDPHDAASLDEARLAIATLARRASSITGFVESYRDFGRTPAITIARFGAAPWADDLARAFRATPEGDGVVLAVTVAPERLRIDGDAALLGQVVLNLLKNAGHAALDGEAPEVRLDLGLTDAGRVRIAVADNGPGVPAALAQEVFLPFFTTKSGGTGVGLSFARQVVLLHGGTIAVAAADGGGAVFEIVL